MGVDARLYLNVRWGLDDILNVIERTQGEKPEIRSHHDFAPGYFSFQFKGRNLNVHTQTESPVGFVTMLSLGSNPQGISILKAIAEVLGGILEENDYNGDCEMITGNMSDGDGLAYFVKYAVVHDGIQPDDLKGFIKSKQAWHNKHRED